MSGIVPVPAAVATGTDCQNANPGIAIPVGTVATASSVHADEVGSWAIDGDPTTHWNSGNFAGWIQLTFPVAVTITGIRIISDALPVTNETYTLTDGTTATPLAVATYEVWLTPGRVLPDFAIPTGAYSSIVIATDGGASWVGIDEIALLTSNCP